MEHPVAPDIHIVLDFFSQHFLQHFFWIVKLKRKHTHTQLFFMYVLIKSYSSCKIRWYCCCIHYSQITGYKMLPFYNCKQWTKIFMAINIYLGECVCMCVHFKSFTKIICRAQTHIHTQYGECFWYKSLNATSKLLVYSGTFPCLLSKVSYDDIWWHRSVVSDLRTISVPPMFMVPSNKHTRRKFVENLCSVNKSADVLS